MDQQHAARLHAQGVSWAISWVGETGWAGMRESYHSPHQSRNSGGRKTQGFQKVESPVAQSGKSHPPAPFQRENRAPEGGVFSFGVSTAALPLWKLNPEKRKRLCEIVAQNAHRCPIPLE